MSLFCHCWSLFCQMPIATVPTICRVSACRYLTCSSSLFTVYPSLHLITVIAQSLHSSIYLLFYLLCFRRQVLQERSQPEGTSRIRLGASQCENARKTPTNSRLGFFVHRQNTRSRYMQCIQLEDARHVQRTYRQWQSKAVRPKDGTCRYIHHGTGIQVPTSS